MNSTTATRIAAAGGFLAVTLGAFGAHGLKPLLARYGTAQIWETAVFYHFIHTVMLFLLAERKPFPRGGVVELSGRHCHLLRLPLLSGTLQLALAGRHNSFRRNGFSPRLGVFNFPKTLLNQVLYAFDYLAGIH